MNEITIKLDQNAISNLKDMFGYKDEKEVMKNASRDINNMLSYGIFPLKTITGDLKVWIQNVGEYKQCGIMFTPKNETAAIDIAFVETDYENDKNLNLYVYDDVYTEDWQKKFVIKQEDIADAFKEGI